MTYQLGKRSLTNLAGVHPDLVKVVKRAITISTIDFTVTEGLRTKARQAQLFKAGASQTMNSRHITGHAVDLAAWVEGGIRWDWPLFHKLAKAMKSAAAELNVPIIWGGVWDKQLADIDGDIDDEVSLYIERRRKQGKKAFTDGPHFELARSFYP